MTLTTAQLQALKADMAANTNLAGGTSIYAAMAIKDIPSASDGFAAIADWYNGLTSGPAFIVWKTFVSLTQVGDNFDGAELGNLTTANATRLQTIAQFSPMGINPSFANRRQTFDDIFSVGGVTKAALAVLWKRTARRIEKLFATGTGSDVAPAILGAEGLLSGQNVEAARSLP